jgi:hypothetical protein
MLPGHAQTPFFPSHSQGQLEPHHLEETATKVNTLQNSFFLILLFSFWHTYCSHYLPTASSGLQTETSLFSGVHIHFMDISIKDTIWLIIMKLKNISYQASFKLCKGSQKKKKHVGYVQLWNQNNIRASDIGCWNFVWWRIFKSIIKVI